MSNKIKSYWHFTRQHFTQKILKSIDLGIVQSFTLFAPRRIGKTEFLEFDLKPALEENKFAVIYFSFYSEQENIVDQFIKTLRNQIKYSVFDKMKIKEINLSWCKINLEKTPDEYSLLELLTIIAIQTKESKKKQLVLLLDEIQELQNTENGRRFIAGLRTALDLNKDGISAIFTGSSQDGLKKMFNDKAAPFFHYGMNLEMELFGREFTDFLADRFYQRLNIKLDQDKLFDVFCKLDRITEYIRHVINQLALEPDLTLDEAYDMYTDNLYNFERLEDIWQSFSVIEQAICLWIKQNNNQIYGPDFKQFMSKKFNLPAETITQGKIQYALEKLLKEQYIVRKLNNSRAYQLNNQFLVSWINENIVQ